LLLYQLPPSQPTISSISTSPGASSPKASSSTLSFALNLYLFANMEEGKVNDSISGLRGLGAAMVKHGSFICGGFISIKTPQALMMLTKTRK